MSNYSEPRPVPVIYIQIKHYPRRLLGQFKQFQPHIYIYPTSPHLSVIHSAAAARDMDVYSIQFGYSAPPTAGVKITCYLASAMTKLWQLVELTNILADTEAVTNATWNAYSCDAIAQ